MANILVLADCLFFFLDNVKCLLYPIGKSKLRKEWVIRLSTKWWHHRGVKSTIYYCSWSLSREACIRTFHVHRRFSSFPENDLSRRRHALDRNLARRSAFFISGSHSESSYSRLILVGPSIPKLKSNTEFISEVFLADYFPQVVVWIAQFTLISCTGWR